MAQHNLKAWLRKQPQPVAVRCDAELVHVPKGVRCWTDLAASIEALNPTNLQCLDGTGKVLRAKAFDAEVPPEQETEPSSELGEFAKLIAQAYEKSTLHSGKLHETSMGFIERQSLALQRAEQECERLRAANAKLRGENAALVAELNAPATDGDESLGASLMAGVLAAQDEREGNVAPIKKGGTK